MAGRGKGGTLTNEQRNALGLNQRDGLPTPLTPPPLYGKLEAKPGPLPDDPDTLYLVSVKQKLITQLNLKQKDNMSKWWPYMPPELTPIHKNTGINRKARKRKLVKEDIVSKLTALEKTEDKEGEANEGEKEDEKDKENKLDVDLEEGEEFEDDNEMDEGTDYADNYFDNGEGFEDEDDNLDDNDDGPIF